MVVKIDDIIKFSLMFAQRAKERDMSEIELPGDFYWSVSYEDRQNVYKDPELGMGSLIDDMQEIQEVLNGKRDMTNLELDRLANIILSVSHHMDRIGFFL